MKKTSGLLVSSLLMLLVLDAVIEAKVFDHLVSINKLKANKALYLTKFKFYNGGHMTMELNLEQATDKEGKELDLVMGVLTGDEFLKMDGFERCDQKAAVSKMNISLPLVQNETLKLEHLFTEKEAKADYMYFVIFACKLNPRPTKSKLKLHFLFDFRNSGVHFSAGDEILTQIYGISAMLFSIMFFFMLKSFYREMIKKQAAESNYAYIIVNSSLLLKMISLVLDLADMFMFAQDGIGFVFLNFLSQATNQISQYILIILLIFLAKGWTLIYEDISEFELFLPISIIIGIFQVIVIGLGKMEDNSPMFYHRYDSFVGWILPIFNMALCVYFVVEGLETLKIVKNNERTSRFIKWLLGLGSFYFAFFPLILLISLGTEPEKRMVVVEVGRILSQLIGLSFMGYVTGSKKGVYKEIALFELGIQLPGARETEIEGRKSKPAKQ